MAIKILVISEYNHLIEQIKKNYWCQIESKYFVLYNSGSIDKETNYDLVIGEETYLSIINLKNIPVVIFAKKDSKEKFKESYKNYVFIEEPVNWTLLYEKIISLDYIHKNIDNKIYDRPKIEKYYSSRNTKKTLSSSSSKLSTKIYKNKDLKKIHKIIENFGQENRIDKKIIGETSIILEELFFTLKSLNEQIDTNKSKVLLKIEKQEKDFTLALECREKIENFQEVLSISKDYGDVIQSFKRNNNFFLNVSWHLDS